MAEKSDDLDIKILDANVAYPYGSSVDQKREPLNTRIETVTYENWRSLFRNSRTNSDKNGELEKGDLYLRVAIDVETGAGAGFVEVDHQHDNNLTIEVLEKYQRRGVATALIKEAQRDHDKHSLLNLAGASGKELYVGLGFKPEGITDHYVWEREDHPQ